MKGFFIYQHLNSAGDILYVGKTKHIIGRQNSHLGISEWKDEINSILIGECKTKLDMDVYEKYYISKLNPKYNIVDINKNITIKLDELNFKYLDINLLTPVKNNKDTVNMIMEIKVNKNKYTIARNYCKKNNIPLTLEICRIIDKYYLQAKNKELNLFIEKSNKYIIKDNVQSGKICFVDNIYDFFDKSLYIIIDDYENKTEDELIEILKRENYIIGRII